MNDFPSILAFHGFHPEIYYFESAIIGFDHDIYNALIHQSPIFDKRQCRITRQWSSPSAFLRCELVTHTGDLVSAVPFFYHQWMTELRYQHPIREIMMLDHKPGIATIQSLLISKHNAMTFLFQIK